MRLVDKRKQGIVQTRIQAGSPTHILIIGKSTSGKTVGAEAILLQLFLMGYKIVSLYNTWRWESAFWTFPAQNKWQINIRKKYGLETFSVPIKIHSPISNDMPKYLPKICQPFSIPIHEMDDYEMAFLGSSHPSPVQVALNKLALEKMKPSSTIIKFILAVRKLVKSKSISISGIDFPTPFTRQTYKVITRNIRDYLKEPIVSSGINQHAVNLKEILNDNTYVSVFALGYLPFNLRCLTLSYLLRKIFNIAKEGSISVPIVIYIDEAADIFPETPENPILFKVRATGAEIARGARGANVSLLLSTQSPLDLYVPIRRQMMTKYIFWMDDPSDLTFLKEGGRKLRPEELERLATFMSGECFVIEQAKPLRYMRVIPPSFHHREPRHNFFKMWANFKGETFPSQPFIDDIEEEKQKHLEEYKSFEQEIKREEIIKKKKKYERKERDYDRVLKIIHNFFELRQMEFTSKDISRANPKLHMRNIQKILSKMATEKILEDMRGRPIKYRIIKL